MPGVRRSKRTRCSSPQGTSKRSGPSEIDAIEIDKSLQSSSAPLRSCSVQVTAALPKVTGGGGGGWSSPSHAVRASANRMAERHICKGILQKKKLIGRVDLRDRRST